MSVHYRVTQAHGQTVTNTDKSMSGWVQTQRDTQTQTHARVCIAQTETQTQTQTHARCVI